MTTLSKEYFDQRLDTLQRVIKEEIDALAMMTAEGFNDIGLDNRGRIKQRKNKTTRLESVLNTKL